MDKEKAMEIAEAILKLQMNEIAFVSVLDLYRIQGSPIQWQSRVREGQAELLTSHTYLERISEIRTAIDEAKPGDDLIELLYREVLVRE